MANFIEIKTATSRMFVNLDCVDAIFPSKKANETVLSFVGSEEYVTAIESYDAIIERILCSPNCSELKPCPFCGAELVKDDFGNWEHPSPPDDEKVCVLTYVDPDNGAIMFRDTECNIKNWNRRV